MVPWKCGECDWACNEGLWGRLRVHIRLRCRKNGQMGIDLPGRLGNRN